MKAEESLVIFIPVYNCGPQIGRVLEKVSALRWPLAYEILLIDNQSSDDSVSRAKEALKRLKLSKARVLRNRQNISLGGSHKAAFGEFLKSRHTHLLVLHGDDQADPADVLPHLESGAHRRLDCLLGARFMPGSRLTGYSAFRKFGNRVLNMLCSLTARSEIYDMGSGLNLYRRSYLEDRLYLNYPNDLTFNVYLLFHSLRFRKSVNFFPIQWKEEDQISNAQVFRQAGHIVKFLLRYLLNSQTLTQESKPGIARPETYENFEELR